MAKRVLFFGSLALAILAAYTLKTAVADKEKKEFKATCPVSGKAATKDSSVNYLRKKVYFCCDNCPKTFKADRKKFYAKANLQLLQTGQIVQVACPLLGKPMNTSKTIKLGDTTVALCCGNCLGKANKADDQVALIFANARKFSKAFTMQNKCPVSGKPIDIEHAVTHKEKKVYFCCPNCPAKFEANPENFTSKLPQFRQRKNKKKT